MELRGDKLGVGPASRILFITQPSQHSLRDQVAGFLEGGGALVQIRIKDRARVEISREVKGLWDLYRSQNVCLMVNDYVDIARELALPGVHLGLEDMPVQEARRQLGERAIIGVTVHDERELNGRDLELADYLGVGPFRFTQTKQRLAPILGLKGIERIVRRMESMGLQRPVYAVGGVEESDIRDLLSAGAYGVAVSGCIALAQNVSFSTQQMLSVMARNLRMLGL